MTDELVTIHIVGLPVALHAQSQMHGDELMREFRLLAEQMRQEGADGLPHRLVELVSALEGQYSTFTEAQEDQLDAAIAAGDECLDLVYQLPESVRGGVLALGAILDEVDVMCRDGHYLLTLATPPELVAYRHWYLDEFTRQIDGQPPVAWADSPHAQLAATST